LVLVGPANGPSVVTCGQLLEALFWSAVINGIVAVPLMVVIILLASQRSVMGTFTASRSLIILGWIATAVVGAAAVPMFIPD
jgi:Mn2+/Fe2+ NRAMP family transporter